MDVVENEEYSLRGQHFFKDMAEWMSAIAVELGNGLIKSLLSKI